MMVTNRYIKSVKTTVKSAKKCIYSLELLRIAGE